MTTKSNATTTQKLWAEMTPQEQETLLANLFRAEKRKLVTDLALTAEITKQSKFSVPTEIGANNAQLILKALVLKGYIDKFDIASKEKQLPSGYVKRVTQEITVIGTFNIDRLQGFLDDLSQQRIEIMLRELCL